MGHGKEIRVPADHAKISDAIAESKAGDTVLVSEGTYRERIQLKPGVAVRSEGNDQKGKLGLKRAERTVIDGGGKAGDKPGVTMAEGAILDGFTVTNVGEYSEDTWQKHWDEKGENQAHEQGPSHS